MPSEEDRLFSDNRDPACWPNPLPLYVTYKELEQIAEGVQETNENYQKINLGIKYFRDITQEVGTGSWHKPQVDVIGLTTGDIWEIATFIKKEEEDYEWDDTTMVEFSVKNMLALRLIREKGPGAKVWGEMGRGGNNKGEER